MVIELQNGVNSRIRNRNSRLWSINSLHHCGDRFDSGSDFCRLNQELISNWPASFLVVYFENLQILQQKLERYHIGNTHKNAQENAQEKHWAWSS